VLCFVYRPGDILGRHALIEQLLVTALCAGGVWVLAQRALRTFANPTEASSG
jgi:hypothetical protein